RVGRVRSDTGCIVPPAARPKPGTARTTCDAYELRTVALAEMPRERAVRGGDSKCHGQRRGLLLVELDERRERQAREYRFHGRVRRTQIRVVDRDARGHGHAADGRCGTRVALRK